MDPKTRPKRDPKMNPKMDPNPGAKTKVFHWFYNKNEKSAEAKMELGPEVHPSPRPPPLLITFLTEQI